MKLQSVTIHKYKSIIDDQYFDVEQDITVLVGMNESGKTSVLEALAKSNYFQDDKKFKYSLTHDYPRKEKKNVDKQKIDPLAITSTYLITSDIISKIELEFGADILIDNIYIESYYYSGEKKYDILSINMLKFAEAFTRKNNVDSKALNEKISKISSRSDLENLISEYKDDKILKALEALKEYFANDNNISDYIVKNYILNKLPKFLYYDEYYALPSRICIEDLQKSELEEEELKTARALFELADININQLLTSNDYEDFKAELEATQSTISEELFKYWGTNKNLEILFDIQKKEGTTSEKRVISVDTVNNNQSKKVNQTIIVDGIKIIQHILDIRVRNTRTNVSLPLKNRSKGFNWFFSFLVWFKKIQEDKNNNYILLLDEPGLNLHASAQNNLLHFLADLSENYQIIYTTHSPFMVESKKLHKVRTVLETDKGTKISESVQEKDPNTLFPLQAALGYNIAQNLFIAQHNLLVEGVSDLVYLQIMSNVLDNKKREGLNSKITIMPTGGLDKVATFISLLRGSELDIVCLLDTFTDAQGKAKLDAMIEHKIIAKSKVKFFDEFLDNHTYADIEDLFSKEDYLKIYNAAFEKDIKVGDLNAKINQILLQIKKYLDITGFNHYKPANHLATLGVGADYFSSQTLDNFEKVFKAINKLFDK
jgi:predicted ATP-dependent endonuclease of OLD family